MRYSLTAGGKRLRPILCLASAEAVGGDRAMAMPAACAIELIHTYSLIHDDLPAMDNDTMRRGRPTLHVVAGEGMAILAGDGLLTEAFACWRASRQPSDPTVQRRKLRVIGIDRRGGRRRSAWSAARRSISPCVDAGPVGATCRRRSTPTACGTMHAKKTGALIRASAAAGAIMGGGDDREVAAIDDAAARVRPGVSDRRRHPRRRGRVGGARQDGRQGRRGRQADLSRRSTASMRRGAWPPSAWTRAEAALRVGRSRRSRAARRSGAGSLSRSN